MQSVRTLLLNASYEPLHIVSWQKALVLWFQDKVEILEYHQVFARSIKNSFQLPSVLRLKSYVRPRHLRSVRFCRENVYFRDGHRCQYCGDKFPESALTLDHVVPVSKNGKKDWGNIVTACRSCNQKKANRTPKDAKMPLLSDPKEPNWLPALAQEVSQKNIPENWHPYLCFEYESAI